MHLQHRTYRLKITVWKGLWLLPALAGLTALAYAGYYITHRHSALLKGFLCLNHCMYRQGYFIADFFNEATKQKGDEFCSLSIPLALALVIYALKKWREGKKCRISFSFQQHDILAVLLLLCLATGLWTWGFVKSVPAYDEVFSAVHCSNVHPFHTWGYYMLPNNHILFNLVNNVAFPFVYDKVSTGRIISGFAYGLLILLLYTWLYSKTRHRGYTVLYCSILMLQFPVWAFAFQARGYALYLLCAWAAAISVERMLKTGSRPALYVYVIASIAGFAVMPSYLFWAVTLALIQVFFVLQQRGLMLPLVKANLAIAICSLLFYLPTITISGLASLTDNQYVQIKTSSRADFFRDFMVRTDESVRYCFAGDILGNAFIYWPLFLIPAICSVFVRKTAAHFALTLYWAAWLGLAMLQLIFRHYPNPRNMIAHDSVTLAAVLLGIHFLLIRPKVQFRLANGVRAGIMCALCAVAASHFILFMNGQVNHAIYYYPAQWAYEQPAEALKAVPPTTKVWCSDESFYPQYLLTRKNIEASHCLSGRADFYILDINEGVGVLPVDTAGLVPVDSFLQYVMYRNR